MNIRSGRCGARCRLCTQQRRSRRRRVLGQVARARARVAVRHVAPPSSVSHTPTAEIASASRSGSPGHGTIECRHSPPPPGCHSGRVGCSQSARLSSQVAPPSRLSNSTPGSPPAYSVPSASPRHDRPRSARAPASPPSGSSTPLGLRPLAGRVVGVEDLRPVEGRRHGREHAAGARVAHRVLDRLAGERARGHRERRRPARPRARTAPSWSRPAARSSARLLRSRAARRRVLARRPRSSSRAGSPSTNTLMWRRIAPALVEDPAAQRRLGVPRARAAASRTVAPRDLVLGAAAGALLERAAEPDGAMGPIPRTAGAPRGCSPPDPWNQAIRRAPCSRMMPFFVLAHALVALEATRRGRRARRPPGVDVVDREVQDRVGRPECGRASR